MRMYRKSTRILSCLAGLLFLSVSCMKDKPESLPQQLVWNPEIAFPLLSDRFGLNAESGFDTTLFDLDTITNLPKWVSRLEIVLEGSVDFDFSSLNANVDELKSILFRITIFNGFPNDVLAQGYFLDAGSDYIDSMFAEGAIPVPPGKVLGNGETIDPAVVRQDAVFESDRIESLEDASVILLRATILNPEVDTSLIPYYPYYEINTEIGAMLDLTFEF
jgi:hypothetical protein